MTDRAIAEIATDILSYLRTLPQPRAAAATISRKLAIEPLRLSAALECLVNWGYQIAQDGETVLLSAAPDRLIDTEISFGLGTELIGTQLHTYQSVRSTNDIAHSLAESGAPEGTIVTAEEQTQGRGRQGRSWHSPAGTGIYVSIILRPAMPPDKLPGLSIVTALALAEAISAYCPDRVQVKWPNDVLISGKKTAGILTELHGDRRMLSHVIIGTGINVLIGQDDFPEELRSVATSVAAQSRFPVRRVDLLQKFLRQFELEYRGYRVHQLSRALPRIRVLSSLIGSVVEMDLRGRRVRGTALDIDSHGRLVVDIDGVKEAVVSGEVHVVAVE